MKKILVGKNGFTVVEAMVALSLGAVFLSGVLSAWQLSTNLWKRESVRYQARIDAEKVTEKIRADVRLSTNSNLVYYPAGASEYTAISVPLPKASSTAGFLSRASNQLEWDKTAIYHTYTTGGQTEIRRTLINSYSSSTSTRQTQLNTTVSSGTYSGATTRVLLSAPTASLQITPQYPTFDGYSASVTRSANTSFGSVPGLSSGTHTVRFEVTGKNASSSNYGIGVDSLALAPSGGSQEAEALTVSAQSGASANSQDMSGYSGSVWGGNYQVNFPATASGHYVTFSTYYDQWLESNFATMTHSNTKTAGTNPYLTLSSREDMSLTPAWQAATQTGSGVSSSDATAGGKSVRTIIQGAYFTGTGVMMRIKFMSASSGGDLVIGPAYFGLRSSGGDGTILQQLYFDDGAVIEGGSDGTGATANPGTATGISIPPGYHAWTNWFIYSPSTAVDYFVSLYVSSGNATVWTPTLPGTIYSYRVDGDKAITPTWSTDPTYDATGTSVYAVTDIAVWQGVGTATSQVYDTKMLAPSLNQLSWSPTLPTGSTISFEARSSDNSDMSGATAWTVPSLVSPTSLALITGHRYVQWRATIQAATPYTSYPSVDDVKVDWPGQTASVEFSGYYTKAPNYGIFKVLVDGLQPTLGLNLKVTAGGTYRDQAYSYTSAAEQKPLNTGK